MMFMGEGLTYQELDRRASQVAQHLRRCGVGPEARVGIVMEPCTGLAAAILGTLKAGGAYVPLDPDDPRDRLAFMIRDAGIRVVLTQTAFKARCPDAVARVLCLEELLSSAREANLEDPSAGAVPGNVAYIMYTSGSTGKPKGVMIEHRSVVNYLRWVNRTFFDQGIEALPLLSRLTFDASLKQLFAPLLSGRTVWVVPRLSRLDPAVLMSELGRAGRVALNCSPSLWATILDAMLRGDASAPDHNLAALLLGGEPLSSSLVQQTAALLPSSEIWNLYGPTEATANACAARLAPNGPVSLGTSAADAMLYVLDRQLEPVPVGAVGELFIGGVGLARGYNRSPGLTAAAFIPHPFSAEPGARLYRTGDLVRRRNDGDLEFVGRVDSQVKIRGIRVELGEIESALHQHPSLSAAAVVPRQDAPSDTQLVAYVVARPDTRTGINSAALRAYLGERLPEYMIPAAFVTLDRLPLTAHGKIDRQALPPPDEAAGSGTAYIAPRTRSETVLAGIWAEVLGRECVGVHDNFFALGGHSLLATQVVTRVRRAFQVELPLRALFEAPTVAGLAVRIEQAPPADRRSQPPPLVAVDRAAYRLGSSLAAPPLRDSR
jgi:amino acid adenylation domain-containing protein